jgi:hypothetical protein
MTQTPNDQTTFSDDILHPYGVLTDASTGEFIRSATKAEREISDSAVQGLWRMDFPDGTRRRVYVEVI